jgi:hypothetical protein
MWNCDGMATGSSCRIMSFVSRLGKETPLLKYRLLFILFTLYFKDRSLVCIPPPYLCLWSTINFYLSLSLFILFTLYFKDRSRVCIPPPYLCLWSTIKFLSLCILLLRTVYLCFSLVVFVSLCGILLSACRVILPSTLITCPDACSNDHSTCAFVVRDLRFSCLKLKWQAVLWWTLVPSEGFPNGHDNAMI